MMVAGPQSVSGSTNFPRAIEGGVEWITDLLAHARDGGVDRIDAEPEAELEWLETVKRAQDRILLRGSRSWFTGYNANVAGRDGNPRYQAYFGGAPRYAAKLAELSEQGYPGLTLSGGSRR